MRSTTISRWTIAGRTKAALLCVSCVALVALAAAPAASAGTLIDRLGGSCPEQVLRQPFLRWLDPAEYTLVPGGHFERAAKRWQLDGAVVGDGNEPFFVHRPGESKSLSLPAGSSATSPVMCTTLLHPTIRLFARRSGSALSTLQVEVLFEGLGGGVRSASVGLIAAGTNWQPTLPIPVVANIVALLDGGQTPVAFRFTPVGPATWSIDDFYLDPKRH